MAFSLRRAFRRIRQPQGSQGGDSPAKIPVTDVLISLDTEKINLLSYIKGPCSPSVLFMGTYK